jgi:hypothetical protein
MMHHCRVEFPWENGERFACRQAARSRRNMIWRADGHGWSIPVLPSLTYDNYGCRTGMSRGNGVMSGYSYDALNHLTGLSHNPTDTA